MRLFGLLKWRAVVAVLVLAAGAGVLAQQPEAQSEAVKKLFAERACVGCNLMGAMLTPAKLEGVNLESANLLEANLYFADLRKANLVAANLTNANLSKAQMEGAKLSGADLTGANLHFATDVNFDGATTTATTTCPDGAAGPCR